MTTRFLKIMRFALGISLNASTLLLTRGIAPAFVVLCCVAIVLELVVAVMDKAT